MRVGLIGTGMVAQALCGRLVEVGHEVHVGARSAESESLAPFDGETGVTIGSFADAAAAGELLINATGGTVSLQALEMAGAANLAGKTLLDLSNALSHDTVPPKVLAGPDNSVALAVQAAFPDTKVVKSLNTMNNQVMIHPELVPGDHVAFMSGDDAGAKSEVAALLAQFGWRDAQILDLGGIETAPAAEMMMHMWLTLVVVRGGFGAGPFNFAINSG